MTGLSVGAAASGEGGKGRKIGKETDITIFFTDWHTFNGLLMFQASASIFIVFESESFPL